MSHVHAFSCIRTFKFFFFFFKFYYTYIYIYIYIFCLVGAFLIVSLSPSLSFLGYFALWHPNASPLHPKTLCVLVHFLPLTLHLLLYDFVMIKPKRTFQRTFVDGAFIWNATSFCWTFLTLTYPLSFIVGVRSHFMTSRSLVHP